MRICGIIVEYNPMTNGHLYHIQKARALTQPDLLVAVMSGNFTQRGEPAIVDKWQRAKAAVENGVDLVFELPFAFACESADYFAKGAISILKAIKADVIVFGTESMQKADYEKLFLESLSFDYKKRLEECLKKGDSYPQAASKAFSHFTLTQPNDLLGFSYIQQIKALNASMDYMTIQRQGHYHDLKIETASASGLRQAIKSGQDISAYTPMVLEGPLHDKEDLFEPLYQKLLFSSPEALSKIHLVNEGIEYRMIKAALVSNSMADFLNHTTTKRYTIPRILRTAIHIIINDTSLPRDQQDVGYLRLLAASLKGKAALKELKSRTDLPLISNFSKLKHPHLDLELAATKLYALSLPIADRFSEIKKEYDQPPYIL